MSNIISKGIKAILDPSYRFSALAGRGFYDKMTDEEFIRAKWKAFYGEEIDLNNPQTLCEKLQWLKLYYRKTEFTRMVDKYEAKKIVAERLGEKYVMPTIGVWNQANEIDFDSLPNQFVLKPTHDSGGLVICRDKCKLDIEAAKAKLEKSLSHNYYLGGREWPYKHVKPRIMAEPLIEQLGKPESLEYKTTFLMGK